MAKRSYFYASELAVCDVDPITRAKVGGGLPTNNQAAIQAILLAATPSNPMTLIVDGHFATSTVLLPAPGYVTVRGEAPGARIMTVPGANGHVFQSVTAPQRPYDPGPDSWQVIGTADFDKDDLPDLVWRRRDQAGGVVIWLLDGAGAVKRALGIPEPASGWKVIGIADFDGDGHPDLAWRRQDDTGEVRIWFLDASGGVKKDIGLPLPASSWKVVGIADFDGDGHADLAWRRQDDTGEVRIWLLDGAGAQKDDYGLPTPDPGWKVVGIADFDGNGRADLAWRRQDDTGEVRIWFLDGAAKKKDIGLPTPSAGWKVIGIADFDGDGHPDLAWRRQDDTGEVRIWLLDGAGAQKDDYGLPTPDPGWKVVGIADFDGNGRADLAWRRQDDTGEVRIWFLDGAAKKKDIGLPLEILGSYVRFESVTIDGFRNSAGYPTHSNVSKVPKDAECWDARGRIDGDGPWFNGLDLAWLEIVELKDVHIFDAPTYGARFNQCHRVHVHGGGVKAPDRTAATSNRNTDGYHFDGGCYDVVISDVTMSTGDDAIAINTAEGLGAASARFAITNVVFDDCNTGVRVYGPGVPTHQVTISNVTGTVQYALLVYGNNIRATAVPGTNHSVTISHADVEITDPGGAVALCLSPGGSLSLNDVKQTEPAFATPFMLFRDSTGEPCISDVVLNDCAIYRSDIGGGAANMLNMNCGRIGTLVVNNFRVTQDVGSSCSQIDYLLVVSAPGAIDTLIVEGGYYAGVKQFLNDPDRIAHFGGTGLVATGLWIPAAKTLPGARFLNADDGGHLYENIGGGVCMRLA
jgi:hypothetical protein